jgi:predicted nucleotidyltransferase component of viral defense system
MTAQNLAASVRQRLLNHAKQTSRPFQVLLQYYAMERFLFRLSQSSHCSSFILKGGLLLHAWDAPLARVTKDVDFLGRLDNSLESVASTVAEICQCDVEADGITFVASSIKTERIKEDAEYEGVRLKFDAYLDSAIITMQLDVGFGDTVHPSIISVKYPTLLEFSAPTLLAYPRETVIAEKFHAMVYLGTANSRMKDFYDVWLLARTSTFDGAALAQAIAATFANR